MDEATRLMPRFYLGSAPTENPGYTYIVLCAQEYQPDTLPGEGCQILRMPLSDDVRPFSRLRREQLDGAAALIGRKWKQGHRVLVSCVMGRNRSALVSALAISEITGEHPGDVAIFIQNRRRDLLDVPALQNPVFWNYLQNYPM